MDDLTPREPSLYVRPPLSMRTTPPLARRCFFAAFLRPRRAAGQLHVFRTGRARSVWLAMQEPGRAQTVRLDALQGVDFKSVHLHYASDVMPLDLRWWPAQRVVRV